ncbi:PREDICTED: DNA repair protein RadA homolog [Brassica oleracea var. oleracea]|uniref:RecA family profile 1 domain-containing protein n=1 Tax=Brassica oleracea var. oleracea TaxID=109376 RepID=A0A0D3B7Q9_BRAOL|nr:PREDICTED: DNA repair protein RadA homolog [Brassica oleracea var. oleracea]
MSIPNMNSLRCFYTRANSLLLLRSSFSPVTIPVRRLSSVFDSLSNQTVSSISDVDTKTQASPGIAKGAISSRGEDKPEEKHRSGRGWDPGEVVMNKKKGKVKTSWVCESCGHSEGQWWGSCRACNKVGTMRRFSEGPESRASGGGGASGRGGGSEGAGLAWLPEHGVAQPLKLSSVIDGITHQQWRISLPGLFGNEVGRVLGGGLAPGSLILIGGDPGIGKSTLLLQIASIIADGNDLAQPAPVLYVSGEESVDQIGSRADRMKIETDELYLFSSSDLQDILTKAHRLSPRALIIDSIQTVYLKEVTGSAGGLTQVKECTSTLLRFAKKSNVPVFLVGHVTKAGDIAGPRVLEHIVDVVLYMEGEEHSTYRLLRSVKNRFGSTDELGVFEMSQAGLEVVSNPSGIYLSQQNTDSDVLAGLAVAVVMDGSRSFLIEVQALCATGSTVSRHVNGVQASRADMIIAVLMKQAGLRIQESGIFLNVANGMALSETAGDLAIAAAICSSFLEFPIPHGVAFIGEIGLGGEIRTVPRMEKRVSTVAKLGFTKCVVPKSVEKSLKSLGLKEIEIIGCKNLKELINSVFRG